LADQMFSLLLQREGARATFSDAVRAVRYAMTRRNQDEAAERWVASWLKRSIGHSLRLCNDIYEDAISIRGIAPPSARQRIRDGLVKAASEEFIVDNPGNLVKALDTDYPYSLRHMV